MADRETHDPIALISATYWEDAKGKLNAVVAALGSSYRPEKGEDGKTKYERMKEEVDAFVEHVEMHEMFIP